MSEALTFTKMEVLTTQTNEELGVSNGLMEDSVWLTTERDTQLINKSYDTTRVKKSHKNTDCVLVVLFESLRALAKFPSPNAFWSLSDISKNSRFTIARLKRESLLKRVVDQLVIFGTPCVVKYDRSDSFRKAKRGNPMLGITFAPTKDALVDSKRSVREGRVNLLALAAAAGKD